MISIPRQFVYTEYSPEITFIEKIESFEVDHLAHQLSHEQYQGLLCIYRNRVIYIYLLTAEGTRRIEVNCRYCLEFALP